MVYKNGSYFFPLSTYAAIYDFKSVEEFKGLTSYVYYKRQETFLHYTSYKTKEDVYTTIDIDGFLEIDDFVDFINPIKPEAPVRYKICKYSSSDGNDPLNLDGKSINVTDPCSAERNCDLVVVEFTAFIQWLIYRESHQLLSNHNAVDLFVLEICKFSEEINNTSNEKINEFIQSFNEYFDRYGFEKLVCGLGFSVLSPKINDNIDTNHEKYQEDYLDESIWFDLDGLVKRWSKYNLSKSKILHLAETNRLEICFNWRSSYISDYKYFFKSDSNFDNSVSRLIEFKQMEFHAQQHHIYKLKNPHSTQYSDLAAIDSNDIKMFIARGEIKRPYCGVNGFELLYKDKMNYMVDSSTVELPQVIINETHLLVTSREVRRYENEMLNKDTSNKTNSPLVENSNLKIIGALVNLLRQERKRVYTQDLIQDELEKYYGDEKGIKAFSKSNLQKVFSQANKALKDS